MQIRIRLAEPFWRTIGQRDITVELRKGATVADLMVELRHSFPDLGQEMDGSPPIVIVGDDEAGGDLQLQENMLLHLVWPIAGG